MKKNLFIMLGFILMGISTASAAIYVNKTATGNNDGTTWADAYQDLQDAIRSAKAGSEIWVAEGEYRPGTKRDETFLIPENVKIYGGFKGNEKGTDFTCRTGKRENTILSGKVLNKKNAYHVVVLKGNNVIDGFTIKDGESDDSDKNIDRVNNGAGIYAKVSKETTISNNIIIDNKINAQNLFTIGFGGGIYASGPVNIVNNIITDNEISAAEGLTTSASGGGIYATGAVVIKNNIISDNDIVAKGATTIASGGGVHAWGTKPITMTNNLIEGNTVTTRGTFSSPMGGGIYVSGTVSVVNNTIVNNTLESFTAISGKKGSAVYTEGNNIKIYNTIIWGNKGFINIESKHGTPAVEYCLIEGEYKTSGVGILDKEPMFVSDTDFRLQPGSPAIDSGDNTKCIGNLDSSKDLAGKDRVVNSTIDMGAYEYVKIGGEMSNMEVQATTNIYPTLTTGKVYIQTADGKQPIVEVYTIAGKLIKKAKTNEVDLSDCSKGVYILRVDNKTVKVVKQ